MRIRGAAPLVALGLVIVVAGCGGPLASGSPDVTVGPSESPVAVLPSAEPTLEPQPSPEPTPENGATSPPATDPKYPEFGWVNRFVMRVAVSDLNVRADPTKSAKSNGKAPKGGLFMMYDWPIVKDGYTWYFGFTLLNTNGVLPALPTPIETGYDEVLAGWMATGTEDTPFLVPLAPRCPSGAPTLADLAAMLDSERISCFGSSTIELQGTFGCGGCGGEAPGAFEPPWLASPLEFDIISNGTDESRFAIHFAPGGAAKPAEDTAVKVRGHFADPRSSTCHVVELGASGNVDLKVADAAAEQWCQGKFVVESVTVAG